MALINCDSRKTMPGRGGATGVSISPGGREALGPEDEDGVCTVIGHPFIEIFL